MDRFCKNINIPTAITTHARIIMQISPQNGKEPDSIILAMEPMDVAVGVGWAVGELSCDKGVLTKGWIKTISGASNNVGEGVIEGVNDAVAVAVKNVGVSVGVIGVAEFVGNGVRVLVGVLVIVGVDVFGVPVVLAVKVILGVNVKLGVFVCVGTWKETDIGP